MQEGKFANLRISALRQPPVPPLPAPAFRMHLSKLNIRRIELPSLARAVPTVTAPLRGFVSAAVVPPKRSQIARAAQTPTDIAVAPMQSAPFVLSATVRRKTVLSPLVVPPSATNKVPPRAFVVTKLKVPKPLTVPALATIRDYPSAPPERRGFADEWLRAIKPLRKAMMPQSAKPKPTNPAVPTEAPSPVPVFTKPHPGTVPESIAPETWEALERTIRRGHQALREDEDRERRAATEDKREITPVLVNANSPWVLLQLLEEQRSLITNGKDGRWTLSPDLANAAGLTEDEIASASIQRTLENEARNQKDELTAVAEFIAADPRRYLDRKDDGWRLAMTAPEPLRRTVYGWRDEPRLQEALEIFAKLTAAPSDVAEVVERRKRFFLDHLFGPTEPGKQAQSAKRVNRSPIPPGWDGGREI